jgi:hypothetical protein
MCDSSPSKPPSRDFLHEATDRNTIMETLTAADSPLPLHCPFPHSPRRTIGATLVAALYVALLVCSPLIVRFAPDPDRSLAVATQATDPIDLPRCVAAPEFGRGCDLATRGN